MVQDDRIVSLAEKIDRSAARLHALSDTLNQSEPTRARTAIESAFYTVSSLLADMTPILDLLDSDHLTVNMGPAEVGYPSPYPVEAEMVSNAIFRVQMPLLPRLKSKAPAGKYMEFLGEILGRKVLNTLPQKFQKFPSAHIVFVNHVADATGQKAPYFDNDNLVVKGVLDATVPFLCFDDAARFCNNLYLYQPDTSDYSELFVVKKGHFREWVLGGFAPAFGNEFAQNFV